MDNPVVQKAAAEWLKEREEKPPGPSSSSQPDPNKDRLRGPPVRDPPNIRDVLDKLEPLILQESGIRVGNIMTDPHFGAPRYGVVSAVVLQLVKFLKQRAPRKHFFYVTSRAVTQHLTTSDLLSCFEIEQTGDVGPNYDYESQYNNGGTNAMEITPTVPTVLANEDEVIENLLNRLIRDQLPDLEPRHMARARAQFLRNIPWYGATPQDVAAAVVTDPELAADLGAVPVADAEPDAVPTPAMILSYDAVSGILDHPDQYPGGNIVVLDFDYSDSPDWKAASTMAIDFIRRAEINDGEAALTLLTMSWSNLPSEWHDKLRDQMAVDRRDVATVVMGSDYYALNSRCRLYYEGLLKTIVGCIPDAIRRDDDTARIIAESRRNLRRILALREAIFAALFGPIPKPGYGDAWALMHHIHQLQHAHDVCYRELYSAVSNKTSWPAVRKANRENIVERLHGYQLYQKKRHLLETMQRKGEQAQRVQGQRQQGQREHGQQQQGQQQQGQQQEGQQQEGQQQEGQQQQGQQQEGQQQQGQQEPGQRQQQGQEQGPQDQLLQFLQQL